MFNVLLVDDESAATEYIGHIIEHKCPAFHVAGAVRSGKACIEKLKEIPADVVITDIKMPGISGLELIEEIKKADSHVEIIIISGYAEFEYAKRALENRVYHYMVKPADPYAFIELMEELARELALSKSKRKVELMRKICNGVYVSENEVQSLFPENGFYAFLLRRNNLPHRFYNKTGIEITSDLSEKIILYGGDENEAMYLISSDALPQSSHLNNIIERTMAKYEMDHSFLTVVVQRKLFTAAQMTETIEKMYTVLLKNIVCGETQVIYMDQKQKELFIGKGIGEALKKVELFIEKGDIGRVRQEFYKLCQELKKQKIPQIQMESIVRQVCNSIWRYNGYKNYGSNTEYLLCDLFFNSYDMDTLYQNVTELVISDSEPMIQKIDSKEYFSQVAEYILGHLSESMSIGKVTKKFGISQSQLSFIFRKYADKSFNEFVTEARIEAAKERLLKNPDMLIKDVALLSGYQDQFYFSRVFKAYTGKSPSEFIQQHSKNGN